MRTRIIGALAVTAFAITGCGKSSSGTASKASTGAAVSETPSAQQSSSAAANTTVAAVGASAVVSTTAAGASAASSGASGPACTGLGAAGSGTAADVKLIEWGLEGPSSVKAGAVTLNITNGGNNKHNLAVVKGTWAGVPKSTSGGVDVTKLAKTDLLGTTAELDGGKGCSTTVTLDTGSYVLFCTLGFGGNSHAARGQHFDLTVG